VANKHLPADLGDTTDEEDFPPPATVHGPKSLLRRPSSAASDRTISPRPFQRSNRRSVRKGGPPVCGVFVHKDWNKAIAVTDRMTQLVSYYRPRRYYSIRHPNFPGSSTTSTAKSIGTTSSELATGYASIINVDAPPVSSGDGNGTDDCNFINSNDFTLEGPFATKEISQLANSGKLEGVYIRREFDKGFVSFDRMARELPDFIYSERINRYFVENQIVSAAEHSSSCETAHARESRVANFLKNKNINATIEFLVKSIKGQSMFKALKTISGITLLGEEDNRVLIDLIVKETDYQVLSDVDKDGFKVEYLAKKSRRYKK